MEGILTFWGFFNILLSYGMVIFIVYVAITVIKLMRERNETLQGIRHEIRRLNKTNAPDLYK